MNKRLFLAPIALASVGAHAAFLDTFDGNTDPVLATSTFSTGATTEFKHWPIGTSGSMGAGRFSVVNKASDIHSAFVPKLDADNNPNGHYAVYNGFFDQTKKAWSLSTSLNAGWLYKFKASFLTLAPDPPYAQISDIRMAHNGVGLGSDFTLTPVPSGTEQWTSYERTFVATGNDVLDIMSLAGASTSGNDFGIDNVQIEAVPEPATMSAMALGALGLLRRKR